MGVVSDERCVRWTVSASEGGEVWTATDVERRECLYLVPCDSGDVLRGGAQGIEGDLRDYAVRGLLVPKYDCVLLLNSKIGPPPKGELPGGLGAALRLGCVEGLA